MKQSESIRQELRNKSLRFRMVDNDDPRGTLTAIERSLYTARKTSMVSTDKKLGSVKRALNRQMVAQRTIRTKGFFTSILVSLVIKMIVDFIFNRYFKS